jgi:hypothetical protein
VEWGNGACAVWDVCGVGALVVIFMFVLWNIVLICGESGMEKRKGICVINGVLSDGRCVVGMHDRWHVGGLVHFGTFPWQAGGGTVSSSRDIDWMKYDMRLF